MKGSTPNRRDKPRDQAQLPTSQPMRKPKVDRRIAIQIKVFGAR
jgi:hypothetical protein